jgi:hypothetical protein
MAKIPYFLLLLLASIAACSHEDTAKPDETCLLLAQHPEWQKIDFKSDQTIQLPDGYTGSIFGIEGPMFSAYNQDYSVQLLYRFCSPTLCYEFGDTLLNPDAPFVFQYVYQEPEVLLPFRMELCYDLVRIGIFFYQNNTNPAVGKLYWLKDDHFLESLIVYYDPNLQQEVERMLQTIKRK